MTKDSELQKRISNCANGQDFFKLMSDFWNMTRDAIKHFATRNIFGMGELCKDQTLKVLYHAYQVEFCYEDSTAEYLIGLIPIGKGNDSDAWMYIA